MKNLNILLALTLFTFLSFKIKAQVSGVIYNDAVNYLNILNQVPLDTNQLYDIISYYSGQSVINKASISSNLAATNVFLGTSRFLPPAPTTFTPVKAAPNGVATGLFGMNVSSYADGATKFLIERGKEELSMVFFNKFKDDLNDYPELASLFPKTTEIINNIWANNVLTLLQELRDAFVKDLQNSPTNILNLRNINATTCGTTSKGYQACSTRVVQIPPIFNREIVLPLIMTQGIINGNNIITIMNNLSNDPLICNDTSDNLKNYILFISMMMDAFRSEESNRLFINENQLKALFNNSDLLNIFLGLMYQKYSTLNCYSSISLGGNNLQQILLNIRSRKSSFSASLSSFDNINLSYSTIIKQINGNQKVDPSSFASLTKSSILLFSNLAKSVDVVLGVANSIPTDFQKLAKNIVIGSDLCIDINQKNYPGIFNDMIQLINTNNIITDIVIKEKLIKYLSFASNMASATNSDEVKEAINTVALPPGSYSIKQKSGYNISLNGYIGYAWDWKEFTIKNRPLYASGVYAPIGLSFSKGLGRKKGGALSIFTSIIDLGSLATYRLSQGIADTLKQEVTLGSIFSPSAQIIFAIPSTPITICTGWRSTPLLTYTDGKSFLSITPQSVFNISMLIDIPIFTLWNRPYSK